MHITDCVNTPSAARRSSESELSGHGQFRTLVQMLRCRAIETPYRIPYYFSDGVSEELTINYAELDASARRVAAYLREHCESDDPVLLVFPAGLQFIEAFWGCLYSGVIAIPVPTPKKRDSRLAAVQDDSGTRLVLTTAELMTHVTNALQSRDKDKLRIVDIAELASLDNQEWYEPSLDCDSIAYLQYTSGSTATPRGVMVTHRNVLANLSDIDESFQHRSSDVAVSWLPHFHDMGLIYGIFQPVFNDYSVHISPPRTFIQHPKRWLESISRFRATHSGAPNFAYDLCVRRITAKECEGLDLSSWRVAFNGAEAVRVNTMSRFADRFKGAGFKPDSFYPAYGLAEATLKVTSRVRGKPIRYYSPLLTADSTLSGITSVLPSCGSAGRHTSVQIVDPYRLTHCPPGEVGEIWVLGDGVTKGYWRTPLHSACPYEASLNGAGPFLRTGDLGLLHDGELFVTGRIKDVIIINGANFYPQDIETTIQDAEPQIEPSSVAAFAIDSTDGEALVIIAEAREREPEPLEKLAGRIHKVVGEQYGIAPNAVILSRPGSIPKTSSGKIQRYRCRELYLNDDLSVVTRVSRLAQKDITQLPNSNVLRDTLALASESEKMAAIEQYLIHLASALTTIPRRNIDVEASLVSLGLSSLNAAELEGVFEQSFGVHVSAATLLKGISIRQLVWHAMNMSPVQVDDEEELCDEASNSLESGHPVGTRSRASIEQERWYWLHDYSRKHGTYNLAATVRVKGPLDVDILRGSVAALVKRHSILAARFEVEDRHIVQVCASLESLNTASVDIREFEATPDTFRARIAEQMRVPFDLNHGHCLRVILIRLGEEDYSLSIVMHHIVADIWSLAIAIDEIAAVYEAVEMDKPSPLSVFEHDFARYAQVERQALTEENIQVNVRYWVGLLNEIQLPKPVTPDHSIRLSRCEGNYSFVVSKATSCAIRNFSRSNNTTVFMTFVAALAAVLSATHNDPRPVIGIPIANRRKPTNDIAIGPFSYPIPFVAEVPNATTFGDLARAIRNDLLAAYEHQDVRLSQITRGVKRGASFRYMLALLPPLHHKENMGKIELSPVVIESTRLDLDLYAAVNEIDGQFEASFAYNPDWQGHQRIELMAHQFSDLLEQGTADPALRISQILSAGLK